MDIALRGIKPEFEEDKNSVSPTEWIWRRYLDLYDNQRERVISEWFYVATCSPEHIGSDALPEDEKRKVLVQQEFDENALSTMAFEKFRRLKFDDWDDFYTKMSLVFIHQD